MSVVTNISEWPRNSAATRALREKSWTVVLRCYGCRRRFAVRRVTVDRLALTPHVPCIHCSAQPSSSPRMQIHTILDMREDTQHGSERSSTE
ncbi:MAG TPA: hypothetical protein VL754_14400 [Verrucomicrobiae bacterium]|jgi:hypothetical protein|nr:hypothetical protein [Verrucomicrobiae bacterium]